MKKNKNSVYCLEFMRRLLKGWSSRLGFILLLVILLLCLFGPLFSPYGVNDIDLLNMYSGPCKAHWFGCDSMGRDIFTRLLYGGRYSLLLGFSSALLSAAIGIVFGIIAGYFGGNQHFVQKPFLPCGVLSGVRDETGKVRVRFGSRRCSVLTSDPIRKYRSIGACLPY